MVHTLDQQEDRFYAEGVVIAAERHSFLQEQWEDEVNENRNIIYPIVLVLHFSSLRHDTLLVLYMISIVHLLMHAIYCDI